MKRNFAPLETLTGKKNRTPGGRRVDTGWAKQRSGGGNTLMIIGPKEWGSSGSGGGWIYGHGLDERRIAWGDKKTGSPTPAVFEEETNGKWPSPHRSHGPLRGGGAEVGPPPPLYPGRSRVPRTSAVWPPAARPPVAPRGRRWGVAINPAVSVAQFLRIQK